MAKAFFDTGRKVQRSFTADALIIVILLKVKAVRVWLTQKLKDVTWKVMCIHLTLCKYLHPYGLIHQIAIFSFLYLFWLPLPNFNTFNITTISRFRIPLACNCRHIIRQFWFFGYLHPIPSSYIYIHIYIYIYICVCVKLATGRMPGVPVPLGSNGVGWGRFKRGGLGCRDDIPAPSSVPSPASIY